LPDILAALRWLLALEVIGLAGLPLARRVFAHLPGGGYAWARPLALLLAVFAVWLLGCFGFLSLEPISLLFCLALLFVLGWRWGGGLRLSSEERRSALGAEAVFLIAFVLAALVRAYNPNIEATEKPMEFAFLNSILRNGHMPPQDPWLSGYAISYYYFGYLMVAAVARLSFVPGPQAFNLGIATLFALTVTGAFAIVRDMVAAAQSQRGSTGRQPTLFGILAGIALPVMGNLEGFLEVLHARRLLPDAFWAWLDIQDLNQPAQTISWLPQRYLWWWRASRVINDRSPTGKPIEVIDEFPFFSFLLGDMHPHVLALPFVLLAVAFALEWALRLSERPHEKQHWRFLIVATIAIGGLGFLNTWDWPVYLAVFAGASYLGLAAQAGQEKLAVSQRLWRAARLALLMLLGGLVAYLPFYLAFKSQASGFAPTLFVHTKLPQYLVMFGPFIFVAAAFAGHRLAALRPFPAARAAIWWLLLLFLPFVVLAVIGLGLLLLPQGQAVLAQLRGMAEVQEVVGERSWASVIAMLLLQKAASPWMLLVVSGIAGAALCVLETDPSPSAAGEAPAPPALHPSPEPARAGWGQGVRSLPSDFALLLLAVGLLLTWVVEFIYLRDLFGTRMNTVFKFYYQAWVLLALACSYGAYELWQQLASPRRWLFALPAAILLAMGLVYPALATWTKVNGFREVPTLDGTRYLAQVDPADYAAIRWLNANVPDSPVIVEAVGGSYSAFARISANTGLPTLLGWDFHELQWGRSPAELARKEEVARLYTTRSWAEAQAIMDKYGVRYVIVGALERQTYGPQAGQLLAQHLSVAYQASEGGASVEILQRP